MCKSRTISFFQLFFFKLSWRHLEQRDCFRFRCKKSYPFSWKILGFLKNYFLGICHRKLPLNSPGVWPLIWFRLILNGDKWNFLLKNQLKLGSIYVDSRLIWKTELHLGYWPRTWESIPFSIWDLTLNSHNFSCRWDFVTITREISPIIVNKSHLLSWPFLVRSHKTSKWEWYAFSMRIKSWGEVSISLKALSYQQINSPWINAPINAIVNVLRKMAFVCFIDLN